MSAQKKTIGYNKGDKYEDKIANILIDKKILPKNYMRAGASDKTDIDFIHKNQNLNIEIKADENADYGQKYLKWDKKNKWFWVKKDNVTEMYKEMKIIDTYIKSSFIPRRFTINSQKITLGDKKYDQHQFERPEIEIPLKTLFEYYKQKNCYYIQIQNYGFYHLQKDTNSLGTKQFDGIIKLRLRAKTINSTKKIYKTDKLGNKVRINTGILTPWNYGFLGVIKMTKKPTKSKFDIEELEGRKFPFKD